jgi:hypothetical protein
MFTSALREKRRMPADRTAVPQKIEFRWRHNEKDFAERLAESARKADRSIGDHAREIVKTALTADDQLQYSLQLLHQEVGQLHKQLLQLGHIKSGLKSLNENLYEFRDDLATSVAKMLADAGRLEPQAAEEWVRRTLEAE